MGKRGGRTNKAGGGPKVADFRHDAAKRKNNPPAKLAGEGQVPIVPKIEYAYSPRRSPTLRFDPEGSPDKLPPLLEKAKTGPLSDSEVKELAEALRVQEPWLEWAGKLEQARKGKFYVDPVALHIHERVSAQAILRTAARKDVSRDLFADPQQDYREAVQFYKHDVDWANRLILGDSLQVMASLARREDLAGKVQMIFIDPPYGIKFASNFQPEVGRRDVKDKDTDLTREPEMVKAYRDTWHLGIHSYLAYLRDRLTVAKELLADTGSIFVQIGDENEHLVRSLMDEVFGKHNFHSLIVYRKTSPLGSAGLAGVTDYILWFCKDTTKAKFNALYDTKAAGLGSRYSWIEQVAGERRRILASDTEDVVNKSRVFVADKATSAGLTPSCVFPIEFQGCTYNPHPSSSWSSNPGGMHRLLRAERLIAPAGNLGFVRYHEDFAVQSLYNLWNDTTTGGFNDPKVYVVQTVTKVVERCMLMTTEPGDLILDPTCGSGTTVYVAEQWGRRWITVDTSRVAVAIARQRLMTSKFDHFKLKEEAKGPSAGMAYQAAPHITLRSIAQNQALDPIFDKHEPILDKALSACNAALTKASKDLKTRLRAKLDRKVGNEGKRSITDADQRRWILPPENRAEAQKKHAEALKKGKPSPYTVDLDIPTWYHWEVPFDTDPDWPKDLQDAVTAYRKAWRAKMDEVNKCIEDSATQEELVDDPVKVPGVVRVSGPFTVEAVQPPEISLSEGKDQELRFGGEIPELEGTFRVREVEQRNDMEVKNVQAYLDQMTSLLKTDGVGFPNNKRMKFSRLERIDDKHGLHAEGRWTPDGVTDDDPQGEARVGVVFGPQYGPVTLKMAEHLIKPAGRRYDDLVIAAFSFAPEVHELAEQDAHPKLKIHVANIRPDVNPGMEGLLKDKPGSQLFSVFGQPRISVDKLKGDPVQYVVTMQGVDIYDPVRNVINSTGADKVAAWFLDSDYDGRTFCITQAFFPDRDAWEKLAKALNGKNGVIDEEAFEKLAGVESLPFVAGEHKRVAVKVIDPRGNEVMQVHKLG